MYCVRLQNVQLYKSLIQLHLFHFLHLPMVPRILLQNSCCQMPFLTMSLAGPYPCPVNCDSWRKDGCHFFMLALSRQHLMESCMVLIHFIWETIFNKTSCAGGRHNMPPPPASWPLTLKLVSKSRVTWATSVPILVFLGLSVLDLGPMYVTVVRQTSDAHHRLMPLP